MTPKLGRPFKKHLERQGLLCVRQASGLIFFSCSGVDFQGSGCLGWGSELVILHRRDHWFSARTQECVAVQATSAVLGVTGAIPIKCSGDHGVPEIKPEPNASKQVPVLLDSISFPQWVI